MALKFPGIRIRYPSELTPANQPTVSKSAGARFAQEMLFGRGLSRARTDSVAYGRVLQAIPKRDLTF